MCKRLVGLIYFPRELGIIMKAVNSVVNRARYLRDDVESPEGMGSGVGYDDEELGSR